MVVFLLYCFIRLCSRSYKYFFLIISLLHIFNFTHFFKEVSFRLFFKIIPFFRCCIILLLFLTSNEEFFNLLESITLRNTKLSERIFIKFKELSWIFICKLELKNTSNLFFILRTSFFGPLNANKKLSIYPTNLKLLLLFTLSLFLFLIMLFLIFKISEYNLNSIYN